jgi:hypothetical protein
VQATNHKRKDLHSIEAQGGSWSLAMSKRKSLEGKSDANKRSKSELSEEEKQSTPPPLEDIATARERARQWHEQQMKLAGMREVEDKGKQIQIEIPMKPRTRFMRMTEVRSEEPKVRQPSKRLSEVPVSAAPRPRSRASVPASSSHIRKEQILPKLLVDEETAPLREEVIKVPAPAGSTSGGSIEDELTDHGIVEPASPLPSRPTQGFQTIEQRMSSQPKIVAEIVTHEPRPRSPSPEEVPPAYSWISLPHITLFCLILAASLVTLFRTEYCLILLGKLKLHLGYLNFVLREKYGDAPLDLDYSTWLSAAGVIFLFSIVL